MIYLFIFISGLIAVVSAFLYSVGKLYEGWGDGWDERND